MKKLFLTAALLIGSAMGTYAQLNPFESDEKEDEVVILHSILHRSSQETYLQFGNINGWRDGGTFSLCFPGHNFTTNWNGGSQGHDDELVVPLGSGALLLVGFGAAYALSKRNKKD